MARCVLAYSGGLDTSVILGWLMDEVYEVHCVYVDLGQPCEDREAILEKARRIGAASARAIDARRPCSAAATEIDGSNCFGATNPLSALRAQA